MDPSPAIPTSFVPKQPVSAPRAHHSGGNLFRMAATFILVASLVGAGLVFGYQKYLESVVTQKSAAVTKAEDSVDSATVEKFIRTRDRFAASKDLLSSHVALTQFLSLLESLTLQSVRFDSLDVTIASDHSAALQMTGVARTFNALAAESSAFSSDPHVKHAIFSGIQIQKGGTVGFVLAANLTPDVLAFTGPSGAVAPSSALQASSTPLSVPSAPAGSATPLTPTSP